MKNTKGFNAIFTRREGNPNTLLKGSQIRENSSEDAPEKQFSKQKPNTFMQNL
jgi:hypothetical protein